MIHEYNRGREEKEVQWGGAVSGKGAIRRCSTHPGESDEGLG